MIPWGHHRERGRIVVARGWGVVGNGGLLCGGHRALIWEDEKVVEMGGGGGCTAV